MTSLNPAGSAISVHGGPEKPPSRRSKRIWRLIVATNLFVLLGCAGLAGLVAFVDLTGHHPLILVGNSMPPALYGGDVVLWRPAGDLRRGDLVAYWYRDVHYVHRIVGLPGETISVQDGVVFIDDGTGRHTLAEPYVRWNIVWSHVPVTLAPDYYLLMQDNRGGGSVMDVVSRAAINGRVEWVVLPFSRVQRLD